MKLHSDKYELEIYSITYDILNAPVSLEEIKMAGKMLETNKAARSDSIPTEFYKYSWGILEEPLSIHFNRILKKGDYPCAWCEGLINPLWKQESRCDPKNYRKITIVSALGKLFEIILNNRLKYVKKCITDRAFTPIRVQRLFSGYRQCLHSEWTDRCLADRRRPMYVCFVDFKSAFDCADRIL